MKQRKAELRKEYYISDDEEEKSTERKKITTKKVTSKRCDDRCDEDCKPDIQTHFCVKLTFEQELIDLQPPIAGQFQPASNTIGNRDHIRGRLEIEFGHDLSKFRYTLWVFNATRPDNQIISAHLHVGTAGVNGPVVVTLFPLPGGLPRNVNGVLVKCKTVTNSGIVHYDGGGNADLQINTVASLYQAIIQGRIYTNVHSTLNPGGIIRGQVLAKC